MLSSVSGKGYSHVANSDLDEGLVPSEVPSFDPQARKKCCKDPLAALIFLAGIGTMIAMTILHQDGLKKEWQSTATDMENKYSAFAATQTLGAAFGVAVVFSVIWLVFIRHCVEFAVYGLFALCLAAESFACGSLFYLANSNNVDASWERGWLNAFAVAVLLLLLYTAYVLYGLINRVALAASMIKVAGCVLSRCPTVFVVSSVLSVCKFAYVIFCGAATWAILNNTDASAFWVVTALGCMTYWGLEILGNIGVVTNYGVLGAWYYGGRDASPSVAVPLIRATTSHFGSICFGSLLVALVETTHDVLHQLQKKGYIPGWVMCCIDRALRAIQSAFEYLNKYGFVQVAVHDESFISASRRAIAFLKYKGLTALISDTIIGRMASVGSMAGGLLAGVVPVLLQRYLHHEKIANFSLNGNQETTLAVAGFLLGGYVVYTLISPFASMVTALLVCFAEHPEVLARDHEEEYKTMLTAWEGVYGADFVDKAATKANIDVEHNGLYTSTETHSLAEELEKIVQMRHNGLLTEEEFETAKEKLLS